jgi:hypothetical protein
MKMTNDGTKDDRLCPICHTTVLLDDGIVLIFAKDDRSTEAARFFDSMKLQPTAYGLGYARGLVHKSCWSAHNPLRMKDGWPVSDGTITDDGGTYWDENGSLRNTQADEAEDQRAEKRKRLGLTYVGMEDECSPEECERRFRETKALDSEECERRFRETKALLEDECSPAKWERRFRETKTLDSGKRKPS